MPGCLPIVNTLWGSSYENEVAEMAEWPKEEGCVAQMISTKEENKTKAHKMNFDSTQITRI